MSREEAAVKVIRHLIGIIKILAVYFGVTKFFPSLFEKQVTRE